MPDFVSILASVALAIGGLFFYEVAIQTWKKNSHWTFLVMWIMTPIAFVIQRSDEGDVVLNLVLSSAAFLLLPRKTLRNFVQNRFEQIVSDIPFYDVHLRPVACGWTAIFCYFFIVSFFFI